MVATIAFVATLVSHRPRAIPARPGGKAVTVAQVLTLIAFLTDSPQLRPMAWATGRDRGVRHLGLLPRGPDGGPAGGRRERAMSGETKRVVLEWRDQLVFQGGEPGGPVTVIDGDNAAAPGPMLTLLLAAAACTGSDVVVILQKMRVPLRVAPDRGRGRAAGDGAAALRQRALRLPGDRRRAGRGARCAAPSTSRSPSTAR